MSVQRAATGIERVRVERAEDRQRQAQSAESVKRLRGADQPDPLGGDPGGTS